MYALSGGPPSRHLECVPRAKLLAVFFFHPLVAFARGHPVEYVGCAICCWRVGRILVRCLGVPSTGGVARLGRLRFETKYENNSPFLSPCARAFSLHRQQKSSNHVERVQGCQPLVPPILCAYRPGLNYDFFRFFFIDFATTSFDGHPGGLVDREGLW